MLAEDGVLANQIQCFFLRKCASELDGLAQAGFVNAVFNGFSQGTLSNEGEGGIGNLLEDLFEGHHRLQGAFLFDQSAEVDKAGRGWRWIGGVRFEGVSVNRQADDLAQPFIDPGLHTQTLRVKGGADHGRTRIGQPGELLRVPCIAEFPCNVEPMNRDDVRLAQSGKQVGSNVGSGPKLNPQHIGVECFKFRQELALAPATFGEGAHILSGDFASKDVVQFLGDMIKIAGRDIGMALAIRSISTERFHLCKSLQKPKVVDQKSLTRANGGIANPANSRSRAHP